MHPPRPRTPRWRHETQSPPCGVACCDGDGNKTSTAHGNKTEQNSHLSSRDLISLSLTRRASAPRHARAANRTVQRGIPISKLQMLCLLATLPSLPRTVRSPNLRISTFCLCCIQVPAQRRLHTSSMSPGWRDTEATLHVYPGHLHRNAYSDCYRCLSPRTEPYPSSPRSQGEVYPVAI
ncbi:hypothetical protein BV25DRAFT_1322659 [Artomyces pyxidatus]|uniref:Uncharacterized protein n=1 Tax=Artomyces pyxidatus TaxID=48021 RepID=A0ACB8SNZ7_9AGAM|nr:hypothetical protein BV25DRAFT_1322659 [Artomyces pyxidatus]